MKTRKILLISLLFCGVGITSSSNAGMGDWYQWYKDYKYGVVIDDQKRRIGHHDRDRHGNELGHTERKHITPTIDAIAYRCIEEKVKNSAGYSKSINSVSIKIKDVITRNQKKINDFAKLRATKNKFNGRLLKGESHGVNCRFVKKSQFIRFRGYRFFLNRILVRNDYPFNVVKVVRKSDEKGKWYMNSSFPDLQGKL